MEVQQVLEAQADERVAGGVLKPRPFMPTADRRHVGVRRFEAVESERPADVVDDVQRVDDIDAVRRDLNVVATPSSDSVSVASRPARSA